MQLQRSSGILLHPTSLPSGRLDADAYSFVDWLAAAGQSWWQMLPLGPPDEYGSPYRARSAFAGSPQLLAEPKAPVSEAEVEELVARQSYWVGGWARFAGPGALADQVRFEREWQALRAYARERGVRLIGDVPIYVADVGADVETWPELFAHGAVAGAPPDALSASGQLWGNPLYDWPAHRATGYRWWIERFRRTFELVDLARIDHFRGFVSYWAVPEGHKTAKRGRWVRGPGRELFDAGRVGELPLIAEDLGIITPAVYRLRDELELPGMAVLHVGIRRRARTTRTRRATSARARSCTRATHDTDTAVGWFTKLSKRRAARDRPRSGRAALGADRARAAVAGVAGDRSRAGRARPRQRGADEPSRHEGRELAWRLKRGSSRTSWRVACATRRSGRRGMRGVGELAELRRSAGTPSARRCRRRGRRSARSSARRRPSAGPTRGAPARPSRRRGARRSAGSRGRSARRARRGSRRRRGRASRTSRARRGSISSARSPISDSTSTSAGSGSASATSFESFATVTQPSALRSSRRLMWIIARSSRRSRATGVCSARSDWIDALDRRGRAGRSRRRRRSPRRRARRPAPASARIAPRIARDDALALLLELRLEPVEGSRRSPCPTPYTRL